MNNAQMAMNRWVSSTVCTYWPGINVVPSGSSWWCKTLHSAPILPLAWPLMVHCCYHRYWGVRGHPAKWSPHQVMGVGPWPGINLTNSSCSLLLLLWLRLPAPKIPPCGQCSLCVCTPSSQEDNLDYRKTSMIQASSLQTPACRRSTLPVLPVSMENFQMCKWTFTFRESFEIQI